MRNSILGFNQEELLNYDVDMNDVLLLDYIYNAAASPSMEHILEDNICYVWISHTRLLEDLPILNIGEDRLKRILKHLVDIELLVTIRRNNTNLRGSKSYYAITEKCEELRYSKNDQVLKTTRGHERPSVKNNTSYNQLISNNKLNNTISKDIVEKPKSKKLSMYEKCINMIEEFTDDEILKNMLREFLKRCLENSREANTQFYSNHFKGKLNKLKEFTDDSYEQRKYVKQTLDNGWNGFYELKENKTQKYNRNTHERLQESGAAHVQSCREELMEDIKNGRAERF